MVAHRLEVLDALRDDDGDELERRARAAFEAVDRVTALPYVDLLPEAPA